MDSIQIRGLRIFAYHGVNSFEKEKGQPFELDLILYIDLSAAGKTDKLEDTVNYSDVIRLVTAVFLKEKNDLIERTAERVAEAILSRFPVSSVTVQVKKPEAPIQADLDYVSVEITRNQTN
ncbi:MAG: dihydroneopterin aldolase [Oscillospiraceae bacterium]|nr:dihydroneopterin aldolase [Oscillospiraceae bacterium]